MGEIKEVEKEYLNRKRNKRHEGKEMKEGHI